MVHKPPDGGWGWMVVFGCFLTHMILGGGVSCLSITYLQIISRYGSSATITSLITSVYLGLGSLFAPVATLAASRWSHRAIVMFGGCVVSIGWLSSGLMPSAIHILLTLGVIGGSGVTLCYSPSIIIMNLYFDKRRAIASSIATSGSGVGFLIVPPVATFFFDTFAYAGAMLLMGGVFLQLVAVGAIYRPLKTLKQPLPTIEATEIEEKEDLMKTPQGADEEFEFLQNEREEDALSTVDVLLTVEHYDRGSSLSVNGSIGVARSSGSLYASKPNVQDGGGSRNMHLSGHLSEVNVSHPNKSSFSDHMKILLVPTFHRFNICNMFYIMMYVTSVQFFAALTKEKGVSEVNRALLLSILGLEFIPRFFTGFLFDIPCVRPHRRHIYTGGVILAGVLTVCLTMCKSFVSFAAVCAVSAIVRGVPSSQQSVIFVDLLGVENVIRGIGFIHGFQGAMAIVGTILSGMIADTTGSYVGCFWFVGGTGIFGGVVLFIDFLLHLRS